MGKKVENLPRLVQAEDWYYQPRAEAILAAMTERIYWGVPRCAVRPRTLTEADVCRGYGTGSVLTYDELISRDLSPAEKQEVKAQWEECRDEPTVTMEQARFDHQRKLNVMARLAVERLKAGEHVGVFVRTEKDAEQVILGAFDQLNRRCYSVRGLRCVQAGRGFLRVLTADPEHWGWYAGCVFDSVIYDSTLRPRPGERLSERLDTYWTMICEPMWFRFATSPRRTVIGVKEKSHE